MASPSGVMNIELHAPLLSSASEAGDGACVPTVDKRGRVRAALRRAARKLMMAQRTSRPTSSKGVPLLRRTSVRHVLSATGAGVRTTNANGSDTGPAAAALDVAARFVDDAMHNRNPNLRVAAAAGMAPGQAAANSWAEQVLASRVYRYTLQAVVIAHCLLAFWEPLPPSSQTLPFSWAPGIAELLFLLLYTFDQVMTYRTFGLPYYHDKKWEPVFVLTLLVTWVDWLVFYVVGLHFMFRFSRPFRPMLGITKRKSLRRLLSSILWTIPRMLDISLLLFILVMFYGTLGMQLFNRQQVAGYSPNDDNFDSWPAASLAIYVLTTTENYPNVANPGYKTRPYVATLFFVSALFVMLWIIVPLILAIVYDHYKEVHKEMVRAKRVKAYLSLVYAYHALVGEDGDTEMDRATFVALVQRVRRVNEEQANLMFDVVDGDGSGLITIAEFLRLPNILRLKFMRQPAPEVPPSTNERLLRMWFDVKVWCRNAVKTRAFFAVTFSIVLVSTVLGGMWTTDQQRDYDACMCINQWEPADDQPVAPTTPEGWPFPSPGLGWHRIWYDVSTVASGAAWQAAAGTVQYTNAVVAPDDPTVCIPASDCSLNVVRWSSYAGLLIALLQAFELGMRTLAHESAETSRVWRLWVLASWFNTAEAAIVAWQCIGYLALLLGAHEALPLSTADVFEVARALPFLRIIFLVPRMRDIFITAGGILRLVANFAIVYAGITYGFAIVGVNVFGGVEQPASTANCQMCQMYTFDTLPRAWLALFQLTVGNNWNSILYPNIDFVNSRWSAWYFMLYRFLMTDVIMNIIEGVMIEAYSREQEEKEKQNDEARLAEQMASAAGLALSTATSAAAVAHDGPAGIRAAVIAGAANQPLGNGSSINARPPGSPQRLPALSLTTVRRQRELFDDISAEDDATPIALPPSAGISTPLASTPTSRLTVRGDSTPRDGGLSGLPDDELKLLEEALRRTEAFLTPRDVALSSASGLEPIGEEDSLTSGGEHAGVSDSEGTV